jgi:hypothetical protein
VEESYERQQNISNTLITGVSAIPHYCRYSLRRPDSRLVALLALPSPCRPLLFTSPILPSRPSHLFALHLPPGPSTACRYDQLARDTLPPEVIIIQQSTIRTQNVVALSFAFLGSLDT